MKYSLTRLAALSPILLIVACGGRSADAGAAPSSQSDPEATASAAPEACLLDRCNDGSQSQDGCTSDAMAAEQCRLGRLLAVGKTRISDANGDGIVSPGETLHVATGLLNQSACDNPSLPGVVLRSSYPGIPNEGGYVTFQWSYVMLGGEEWTATTDIVIPSSVKPGTRITFELTPTSDCGQPWQSSVVVE